MAQPQLRGRIGIDGERQFKEALRGAGNSVKLLDSQMQLLKAEFKDGEKTLEQYQREQELLTAKVSEQKKQVATMEDVLAAVKGKFGENSDQAVRYATMLNKTKSALAETEGQLQKCTTEMGALKKSMEEGTKATKKQGDAAEDAEKKHSKLRSAADAAGAVMKGAVVAGATAAAAALAAVGAAAAKATVDLTNMGTDYQAANNMLSAQTGATGAELQQLSGIAQEVFHHNFGESIGEVNEALAVTKTNTGLMGDELKAATESGFLLRDTFGFEFQESSRTARTLMKNFGLSAEEAYNLIAIGAQRGANQNGDMLDVLAEYGPMYAQMGMSADQMMTSLIKGNEAGVYSIDKVGDAMKEFSIRCVDGSETTKEAMTSIGLDADAMAQQFAQGGESARFAFQTAVEAIMAIEDPVKRSQTAVQLFGTQFEDIGPEILPILAEMAAGGELTADALGQIAAVRYDDLNKSIEGFSRKVQAELAPVAQEFSALAKSVADEANAVLSDGFQPEDAKVIGEALAGALVEGIATIEGLMTAAQPIFHSTVSAIGETIGGLLPTMIGTLLPAATGLLQSLVDSVTKNVEPLTKLATDIVTSIAGFLVENASGLFGAATELLIGLVTGISDALPALLPAAANVVTEIVAGIGSNLPTVAAAGLDVISNLVTGILNSLPTLAASLPQVVSGFVTVLVENMPSIVESGANILTNLVGGMLGMLAALPEMLNSVGAAIVGALSNIDWGQWGQDMIQGLVNGLSAAVTTLMSSITGVFSSIWAAIKGVFGINSPSTVAAEAGGFILQGLLEGFRAAVDGVVSQVKEIFGKIWDAIKNIFGFGGESDESKEAKAAGKDIMTGMKDGITGSEDDLKEAVQRVAKTALSTLKKEFGTEGGGSTQTKTIGENLIKGLTGGLSIEASIFEKMAGKIFDAFQDALNTAFGVQGTGLAGLGEKTAIKFKDIGAQICKGLADGIKGSNDDSGQLEASVQGVAEACIAAVRKAFGLDANTDSGIGGEWITNIASGIAAMEVALTAAAETVAKAAHKALVDILSGRAGLSIGSTFGSNVASGITSRYGGVASAASGLGTAAIDALWGAVGTNGSKFTAIGAAISAGIAGGITAGQGEITAAATAAAEAAYNAACAELEIHSPSRKGRYIGSNYIQSVAMGMDDSRKQVTAAAASVARSANSTTQQTLQVQAQAIDYDRLGRSVARANREAGLGNTVMVMDKHVVGQTLEPTVMRAGQTRSRQTVSGRSTRLVTV